MFAQKLSVLGMRILGAGVLLLSLGGCQIFIDRVVGAGHVLLQGNHAQRSLAKGIASYDEGDYSTAIVLLQHTLEDEMLSHRDRITAYKYLAFSHCISAREKKCQDYFERILEISPAFNLSPAEAGHPVWGPVFRNVKAKKPVK